MLPARYDDDDDDSNRKKEMDSYLSQEHLCEVK